MVLQRSGAFIFMHQSSAETISEIVCREIEEIVRFASASIIDCTEGPSTPAEMSLSRFATSCLINNWSPVPFSFELSRRGQTLHDTGKR